MGPWQMNILASWEGTTKDNPTLRPITAYGFSTETDVFVALPARGLKGRYI